MSIVQLVVNPTCTF